MYAYMYTVSVLTTAHLYNVFLVQKARLTVTNMLIIQLLYNSLKIFYLIA